MFTPFSDEIVQVSDLRKNLSAYLEKVRQGHSISIMQGDKADIALVRREDLAEVYQQLERARALIAELDSLVETYEIMTDEEMMEKIRLSEEDIAQDRYITLDELKAELGL
jgi:antitoxin (DNA-binding transcriptional repressor) of toxin-antitoxin stability system